MPSTLALDRLPSTNGSAGSAPPSLELSDLLPDPREEWRRLLRFVGWDDAARQAAVGSVEPLFRRGPDLVAETYAYLASVPETAAVLGWETRIDEAHLEERRRFFTVWLARTLGLDTSDEFALYLFRAGHLHAGRGPRRVHVSAEYVTASIGLVQAHFARTLADAGLSPESVAAALGAWSRYLAAQLDLMLLGYRAARDLDLGPDRVRCSVFGRLRALLEAPAIEIGVAPGAPLRDLLRRFFSAFPTIRDEALECVWEAENDATSLWQVVLPRYVPRKAWRVLLNGRDVAYGAGFDTPVRPGDEVQLFPPGR